MGKQPGKGPKPDRALPRYSWAAGIILVIAVAAGIAVAWRGDKPIGAGTGDTPTAAPAVAAASAPAPSAAPAGYVRRETRPTLDPAQFVGKARQAHQIAREIPDVLDQLYCYCQCDKTVGHKSLLSCYTDGHAAT